MPNCADFKDDCATDAFIQKQCAATCGVGAAKAAAPANDPKKDGYIKELEAVVDELPVPHRPYATLDELKSKIAKAPKGGADDGKKDAKIKELEGTVNELKIAKAPKAADAKACPAADGATLDKKNRMIKVLQGMVDEL